VRKIAILPALLTLGNGICGFAAIAFASKIGTTEFSAGNDPYFFKCAGWFIMMAMVFDMLDGYVARLSRTASKFGGELDSLCDAISFGVAPAFLLLKMGPGWEPRPLLHQILAGIATLFMVCVVLRLARFNVENTPDPASHKRFKGLPSPGGAGCLASLAIFRGEFPSKLAHFWPTLDPLETQHTIQRWVEILSPLGALLIALLMVSLVPYPHVTKQMFKGRRHVGHLIQLLLAAFLILLFSEVALLVIFWGYALCIPLRYLLLKNFRPSQVEQPQVHPESHG
jgi:CDP-diacylglycerol--serine O-phosphatidyltransferase